MNTKAKKRLIVATGLIVVILVLALASLSSLTSAKTVSLAQAIRGDYVNQKIQVSGNVVADSFYVVDDRLTFKIDDPDTVGEYLAVTYDGGVSSTFGNGVSAICTGKIDESGVLHATDLVTKCPSKYENVTNALGINQLIDYGSSVYGKPVKVFGVVKPGSLGSVEDDVRFIIVDSDSSKELIVEFDGALPEEVREGTVLVVTGSLSDGKKFTATNVSLKE